MALTSTDDQRRTPPGQDVILAAAGVLPLLISALVSLDPRPSAEGVAITVASGYGGCLLCFLGGVRRGLSFRQPAGPTLTQIVTAIWLFALGAGTIFVPWHVPSLLLLMIGLVSALYLDARASQSGEVPRYFWVLRPIQLTLAIASVAVLTVRAALG